jgi:hypothetical protein
MKLLVLGVAVATVVTTEASTFDRKPFDLAHTHVETPDVERGQFAYRRIAQDSSVSTQTYPHGYRQNPVRFRG